MKILYKILYIFILLNLPAFGLTIDEQIKISNEATAICKLYNKPCVVQYSNQNKINGYTTRQGIIVLTSGLTNKLNYNEVRAVALHEVGHNVLDHYKRIDEFMDTWNLSKGTLVKFRHKMEYEADLFATSYFLYNKEYNYLPEALMKIDPKLTASQTHPSTPDRIYKMKQINLIKVNNYKRIVM